MSEQTDTYAYNAFLETLLNYNRVQGETLLAPQGWVNCCNVTEHLTAGGAAGDICTTNGWGHGDATPLKTATVPFYNNNKATLIVHLHLEAFHTGRVQPVRVLFVWNEYQWCGCQMSSDVESR